MSTKKSSSSSSSSKSSSSSSSKPSGNSAEDAMRNDPEYARMMALLGGSSTNFNNPHANEKIVIKETKHVSEAEKIKKAEEQKQKLLKEKEEAEVKELMAEIKKDNMKDILRDMVKTWLRFEDCNKKFCNMRECIIMTWIHWATLMHGDCPHEPEKKVEISIGHSTNEKLLRETMYGRWRGLKAMKKKELCAVYKEQKNVWRKLQSAKDE